MKANPGFVRGLHQFRKQRIVFWNGIAEQRSTHGVGAQAYYQRLYEIFQFQIPAGQRVIEIGCGEGDLLASVHPGYGLGIDFAEKMVQRAKKKHPELDFLCADGLEFYTAQPFDIVILSDLVNDVWDVQTLLENLLGYCHPGTRIVMNLYSRLWGPALKFTELLGLSHQTLEQNWLSTQDISNLLDLAGFEVIRISPEILFPLPVPFINSLCNKFLVRFPPFRLFALTNLVVARPNPALLEGIEAQILPSVSVVIPARNEAGNILDIFDRLPQMGSSTELIFVEGHSTDNTFVEIEKQIKLHPERKCSLVKQSGRGKGDAVRLGFRHASGDILMILDADLTVPPENLQRFYEMLVNLKGEFINGVRLVYPMEEKAMKFFNIIGNKFFSIAFSWLLNQPIKDTLCGTKALQKADYHKIEANRSYFGDFDPFGDFDLLFGAARLNLKIVDLPVRYGERTYGQTNIQRWKHGFLLLRMVLFAAKRIKFI